VSTASGPTGALGSAGGSAAEAPGGAPQEVGSPPAAGLRAVVQGQDPLWQNRDFRIVLGGQSISAFGDAITFTALPLLVAFLTGSGLAMGTVGALQTLPDLLIGLPAGALADRWDRRRMMIWADLGRALLTALVPLSYLLGWDTMLVIILVTAPINALRVVYMAAFTAVFPSLVGRDQVGRANGYAEAILSLSFVIGPVLAGLLVGIVGAPATLAIDAATFAVSAASLMLVRRPLQAERGPVETRLVADIREGIGYIVREPTLRIVIAFWSTFSVITAPLVATVIFFLTIDRGAGPPVVGLVLGGYGVGYLAGAIVAGRLARGPLGRIMLVAGAAVPVTLAAFVLVDWPPVQAAVTFASGVSSALILVPYLTLRATIPPDVLLGRVGSTARMLSVGLAPVGVFLGGLALDAVGGAVTLLAIAASVALAVGAFAFSRQLRTAVARSGPVIS
jgi:Na+/melibiose symporter-like transporter